jgi:tetratricopeptide (TPR) repeat protein
VNLGAALAHQKRYDEAIAQYKAVLVTDPRNGNVRMNLALAYEETGDLSHAVSQLEFLHDQAPDDPSSAMVLADCYFRMERYRDAVGILRPLEPSMPYDLDLQWLLGSALIQSGLAEEGLKRIDALAEKTQNAEAYLLAGKTRLALSQYDLARRDFDAATRLNPALPGLQTLDGMLLEQTADYPGAEAALRKALLADPQDFDAHFYMGAILYFKRELKEARQHLEKALQLRPTSSQVRYEMALVQRADGDLDGALKSLELVVHQNPEWMQPHVELSALYYKLHRPDDGAKEREIVDRLTAAHQGPAPGPMP